MAYHQEKFGEIGVVLNLDYLSNEISTILGGEKRFILFLELFTGISLFRTWLEIICCWQVNWQTSCNLTGGSLRPLMKPKFSMHHLHSSGITLHFVFNLMKFAYFV
ncbi:unnamed protein product [Ilex paraguariensis]|uniref:Uncharacterized protein n=1 Tax=Ilex paraguariensis TaxID=185542 RepID=A0ABC8UTM4_9AQUA